MGVNSEFIDLLSGVESICNSDNSTQLMSGIGQTSAAITNIAAIATRNPFVIGANITTQFAAATTTVANMMNDIKDNKPIDAGDLLSLVGNCASICFSVGVLVNPQLRLSAFVAVGLTASIGSGFYSGLTTLNDVIAANFTGAQNWTPPRVDPLILDLDGDGVETLGINTANPTLFDGNADGVRTATGWVKADDGFLVLDRNGNGLIDNGTELFGDATPLFGGGAAVDGFGALAQEDTTNDGVVNNQDLIIEVGLGQLVGRGAAIGQFVSLYNQSKDQFFQLTMQH